MLSTLIPASTAFIHPSSSPLHPLDDRLYITLITADLVLVVYMPDTTDSNFR